MKLIFVLLIICSVTWAAPQSLSSDPVKEKLQAAYDNAEDIVVDDGGHFSVRFTTEDGKAAIEEGIIIESESAGVFTIIIQKGSYSYISNDGIPIELVYDTLQ